MSQEAEHKTAAVGEGDAAEAEGYPVPQGGGAGRTHHDIHYLLKYMYGERTPYIHRHVVCVCVIPVSKGR